MDQGRTPTFRLLAGLAVTLSAVAVYSAYTVWQLRTLESLQAATIDRDRIDSLLLLRFTLRVSRQTGLMIVHPSR